MESSERELSEAYITVTRVPMDTGFTRLQDKALYRALLCWVKISPWGKLMTSTELHGLLTLTLPCCSIHGNHKEVRPRIQGRRYRDKGKFLGLGATTRGYGKRGEELRKDSQMAKSRSPQLSRTYCCTYARSCECKRLFCIRILARCWATTLIFVHDTPCACICQLPGSMLFVICLDVWIYPRAETENILSRLQSKYGTLAAQPGMWQGAGRTCLVYLPTRGIIAIMFSTTDQEPAKGHGSGCNVGHGSGRHLGLFFPPGHPRRA
ncbi:hypothetical protein BGX38DRAFT_310165 [Terfezia claveryi]|nr:hypothetical protein BGX38DRAFT_310165 [Terfezia claveryi]